MSGFRRGALCLAGTAALLGLSTLGAGAVSADVSPAPETPLERVNALVQPSIVYLQQDWAGYVYDKANKQYLNGGQAFQLSFQCTGFVVNPDGYIATAGHCVDQGTARANFNATAAQWAIDNGYYVSDTLTVDDIVGFQDYRVETQTQNNRAELTISVGWGAAASGIETTQVRRARVVGTQKPDAGDVALLKVQATDLNALRLSDQEVDVGTSVVSIGYPVSVDTVTDPDLTPSFKDGSISSVKTVQGGLLTVYEISAAVSGGMSGGPTVNLDGEVVGVNSFGISGETQPFNFVRPSDQLTELLASSGVENTVSETTQTYRDGLTAYWDGDKAAAVTKLSTVAEAQPSNQLAAEYLAKAKALPDPPKSAAAADNGNTSSVIAGLVILGVLGGAVVLVIVLIARRSRGRVTPPAAVGRPTPVLGAGPVPPQVLRPLPGPVPSPPAGSPASGPPPSGPQGAAQTSTEPGIVMTPKFCGGCGAHSHPGEKFCEECGEPLLH